MFPLIFVLSSTPEDMINHTFLYDDACPMCKAYTGAFTRLSWSECKAFSRLATGELPTLDLDRGRHEIPLVDGKTGEVRYGLDAMTTVIAEALPAFEPLLRSRFFIAALKPLYWLITYNRRVIAGTKPPAEGFDCAPDFHPGWRLAYVSLMMTVIALVGVPFPPLLIGFGLALVAGLLLHQERLTFLGHLVTVLFLATIALAVLPAGWGVVVAYGITIWEGGRRLA